MPFLNEMVENGAIHASINNVSNHLGLPSLIAGIDEKHYLPFLKSWLFGNKPNVNNLVDNAQYSWLIGNEELNSYFKGLVYFPD